MGYTLNGSQENEVAYITGVGANGAIVPQSFHTWNEDSPATYQTSGPIFVGHWGGGTAGNSATISFSFDAASNWTTAERGAFTASFSLIAAEAGVHFTYATSGGQITITRAGDGTATGGTSMTSSANIGSTHLGTITAGTVAIDTSVPGFGPIGSSFSDFGGYPWTTVIHEIGHTLGLGHGGAYGYGGPENPYTNYDSLGWTVMSYIEADDTKVAAGAPAGGFDWGLSRASNGSYYSGSPTTPMLLDIVALQRLYGLPTDTPLSGGQVFGFHTNIAGDVGKFFDFTINTKPIVTLWDAGSGNTLDLSGFSDPATVDLHDGAFSSVAGLTNNLAIGFGVRIDTAIGGSGNDTITANDNSDVLMGGAGGDHLIGGAGNDHLYGQSSIGGSDGADSIFGGAGNDYLQGNAGNDTLDGGAGADRINGGADADLIYGGDGDDKINGNLGNDTIDGGTGNDYIRGGQGDDQLSGGDGNDQILGDLGNDTITGGAGIDVLTGGAGADTFVFATRDASFSRTGIFADFTDTITDFTHGTDHIALGFTVAAVLQQSASDFGSALDAAQTLLSAHGGDHEVAAIQVGSDTILFFGSTGGDSVDSAIRLTGVGNSSVGTADFI